MPEINQLQTLTTIAGGDQLAVYDADNGDARKSSITLLLQYIQDNITFPSGGYTTQYAAPSTDGVSIPITGTNSVHLIVTPTVSLASLTIVLPGAPADKQQVLVNCTQLVTALTIDGNGAISVTGEPTTLAQNDFFTLKYDEPTSVWYRVG